VIRSVKTQFLFSIVLFVLLIISACVKEEEGTTFDYSNFIPSHFPAPDLAFEDLPTEAKIKLGKKLFYDPIMSADGTISCASCHNPNLAFSDDVALSLGVNGALGTRNAPTLANMVYQKRLLREGGLPTLEMQVLVPIQEHNEFNTNILLIADKLNQSKPYRDLSVAAFGRSEIDAFVITRSIAAFERVLVSGDSKYDQSIQGKAKLNEMETLGKELFFSDKTQCSSCHGTFLFTNQTFQNNGLYLQYNDAGKKRFTDLDTDDATFKVPTLRNIALTSPYMHDGSIQTLEAVIEHYNSGGQPHQNKSHLIHPLDLTKTEKEALLTFLKTLTDQTFINNKYFRNE
jgi:cytochrome c peroxidase